MSDSGFLFDVNKTEKMSISKLLEKCSIPAFLSKNTGPGKVVRN